MTNLNPEATVIGKIRNVLVNFKLPKANKTDNTLVFSISKSQEEANIQIVFDKELTPEQIKKIERITNGDVNKFFNNEKINRILKDVNVDEVIVTKFVGKKVSLFPKHAGKVTFKNCTFKDNSQIYIQDNDVTFDGCTFGDGVSIHSLNENANVTIKDSKLPKKIGASVKQEQRILDRKRALKFFGKFKGLTLQNNYDEERNGEKILGGLIDAGVAEIINNGEKQPILFKDNNGQLINSKLILKLYGGSLIKKSNLGQELYAAQIEAKKNDLISQNKADTNTSDEEIETHCIISKDEKILRSVNLVNDTFEYEESLKREALRSEKKDKKRALESLEETRKSVAKSAYNEIKSNHKKLMKKLMADYKKTLPKVIAQTHDEMNEEEKKSFSKKYEGNISHERDVKKFFKKQFKKLKGQVDGSNNDTTASCTPTSKSTDAQNSTNSQPTQNNGSNSDPTQDPVTSNSANGEQYTDSDTQNQDQNQTLDLNTNEAQNADTTTNNTQASNAADAQSTNAASDEQFASQANDDDTELNNDEEESDTSSNNGNIPDEESTETEEEETKAPKNSDKTLDVSAGTSDMENDQKEENNNQETTASN